jgi:N-acetylglucosamine-6-sulfatase
MPAAPRPVLVLLLVLAPVPTRGAGLPALARLPGVAPRSIVFILCDDHRHDAPGFMGHPFLETPRLEARAQGGGAARKSFRAEDAGGTPCGQM